VHSLNRFLAAEQTRDRLQATADARAARYARPPTASSPVVTIRLAQDQDAPALTDLSELDGRRVEHHPVLVAEVDGRLAAARDIDGHAVADPFRPTAHLLDLLAVRARQIAA
jgi:hypothetical protein